MNECFAQSLSVVLRACLLKQSFMIHRLAKNEKGKSRERYGTSALSNLCELIAFRASNFLVKDFSKHGDWQQPVCGYGVVERFLAKAQAYFLFQFFSEL